MKEFKQYQRKEKAELREVDIKDIIDFKNLGKILIPSDLGDWGRLNKVSISDEDLFNGSPKLGDMIARNPKNHNDQWLVAEKYFKDNFEL